MPKVNNVRLLRRFTDRKRDMAEAYLTSINKKRRENHRRHPAPMTTDYSEGNGYRYEDIVFRESNERSRCITIFGPCELSFRSVNL